MAIFDPEVIYDLIGSYHYLRTFTSLRSGHKFHDSGEDPTGPDLTGYGSRQWLIDFISNPAHERFYGKRNDRMPAFGEEKQLDPRAIGLIADWLRGDWYEPEIASRPVRNLP